MQCNQPRKQKSPVQTLQRLYRPDSWSANCTRYRADLTLWHRNGWLGHLGINKTKERLLLEYYWPGCFKDVENYVRSCDACWRVEKPGDKCKTPLKLVPLISVVPTTGNQHSGAFAAEQRRPFDYDIPFHVSLPPCHRMYPYFLSTQMWALTRSSRTPKWFCHLPCISRSSVFVNSERVAFSSLLL